MIVVVTTISVYLAVYKGVPLDQFDDEPDEPGPLRRLLDRARKRISDPKVTKEPADAADA